MEPEKPENDDLDSSQEAAAIDLRELWDKKPDESQRAFAAFARYRDAEKRSLKAIADSLNCSVQNVFWWSSRHNWKLRCDAFDLEQDRQQRVAFARNRVRMRERHLAVAQAMLNVAGHALHEWQNRIAGNLPLDLAPEQIALLTKCAIEIERSTTGEDGDRQPPVINILFGTHRYSDEKASDSGEVEWKPQDVIEREQYDRLNDDERRGWESWKNPPRKKLTK